MRNLIAIATLLLSSGASAQEYTGGLPEADAILTSNPQIELALAEKFHAESVRLRGIADVLNEKCPAEGTGDDDRDLRCAMILGAWINSRESLMSDVRAARDGNYEPPKPVEDARCMIAQKFNDPSYAERMSVKCNGPYLAE